MRSLFRALNKARFSYRPLVEVFLYQENLKHNYRLFSELNTDMRIAPVLKSNAYGHGLVHVATLLDGVHAPFFVVDSYFEALVLRNERIHTPSLVIGYTCVDTILRSTLHDTAFMMTGLDQLKEIAARAQKNISVHLKIDTGMHRQGIAIDEIDDSLRCIAKNQHVRLEGIATHLADADGGDPSYTESQIGSWNTVVKKIRNTFPDISYVHCAASAGSAYAHTIDANVLRLGIGLYGLNIGLTDFDLLPVLELRTIVGSVKHVKEGEYIGYNCTYKAPHDMMIAVIPVGYAEGLDRRLSNRGSVLIRDTACPIVGRVSMNITTVDVSHCPAVKRDDAVIVYSACTADANTIAKSAVLCDTITHELLVHINPQLRRTVK